MPNYNKLKSKICMKIFFKIAYFVKNKFIGDFVDGLYKLRRTGT